MIPRQRALRHTHFDTRHQTGEKDCALHLRTRTASVPIHAAEIDPVNRHRQTITVLELELRSHVRERLGDSLHRTPTQTRIAHKARGERLARHNTCHQPRRCSTVSAIERLMWRPEGAQTGSSDSDRLGEGWYSHAERAQYVSSRTHIFGIENAAHCRFAVCERRKNE